MPRRIDLWTHVRKCDKNAELKRKLLAANPLTAAGHTYDFSGTLRPGRISPALLATIRVVQATADELPVIARAFEGAIVSVRNERATYAALIELVRQRQGTRFVLDDDRKALAAAIATGASSEDRKLMALTVRVSEGNLLRSTLELLSRLQQKLGECDVHT